MYPHLLDEAQENPSIMATELGEKHPDGGGPAAGAEVGEPVEAEGLGGEDPYWFEITAIPANLLVDGTGKIVAVDLTPADLKVKLQQDFVAYQ